MTAIYRAQPHPDVLSTPLPERELVLLNQQSGEYYTLNETGLSIWEGLCQGEPLPVISQRLAREYDLTAEEAEPYVQALVTALLAENLITVLSKDESTG